ncbi:hypothetical protein JCM33374_g2682 [Metschnikowia sp. JCM 33374]|nr:hypothetical protein JCM33374_g2682 [Metschnikowia sp. JCM 33374]
MSSLYKLSISGIRSFSPKDHETIQFGSPLTLICGQNGCGKTTIIESLKYATTGDLPPNSKGGAFVNDPTIADRSVVNAEIKLGFISVDGKSMTVTRNMQLNRKRAVRGAGQAANTFKSLEGQLAVVTRGEKTSISTKNLELDTRVPLYLGASKAILEYVIFCHQDDSLWPLSEAGVLKKRFDEIFEASKFTKVLDSLKTIRKDMATDIRLIEQSVQHAQVDKTRASKIKEKLAELVSKAEAYSSEIASLTMDIEDLERRADALFHSNQAFQQTLSEYERLRLLVESTRSAVRRLESSITLLREPDEELASMAANFGDIKAQKSQQLGLVQHTCVEIETTLAELQQEYHALVRDEGSLAAKKTQYLANLAGLGDLKSGLLAPEDASLTNQEVVSRLTERQHAASAVFQNALAENNTKRESAQALLQGATDKLRKEEERLSYCREEISGTTSKTRAAKNKLAALAVNEETLELEKSQLESLRLKLERKRASLDTKARAEQIEKDNNTIYRLESELEELMRKLHSANKSSDLLSKIDLLKESREVKSSVLEKYVDTHTPAFFGIFNADIDTFTAEGLVETQRKKLAEEYDRLVKQANQSQAVVHKCDSEVQSTEKTVAELKAKWQKHSRNALAVLTESEIPEYETLVQELEEDYKTAVYNLNTFEVTKSYKTKAMELAKVSKCCALCNRGMNQTELETFVREIQHNVATVTADKLNIDVENTAKDLHEMKSINADVFEYRRLKKEIERLENALSDSVTKRSTAKKELESSTRLVEESKDNLTAVEALSKPVADISRMSEEIRNLDNQISEIHEELNEVGVSSVSMTELQKLQQQKNFEIKNLRQNVADAIQEGNTRQKEMSRLEYQFKEKELLISKLQLSLSESMSIKHQIKDLETQEAGLRAKKDELETTIGELQRQQDTEKTKLQDVENECGKIEATNQKSLDKATAELDNFKTLFAQVEHFEQFDSDLVAKNEKELSDTKQKMEELNSSRREKEEEARQLQSFINDASNTERNIRDNLELRDTENQLQQQQEALSEMDIENAEREKEQYQVKSRKLREQIAGLNEQHYGKVGEVKQIKDQIQTLQTELQTDFQDVDKHYHNEWIKLQTNLLVSTDLQTYSQALDNAIMKYHSMKMDEINRILRELWTQTYRGTDIDGIEIKCDVTNQTRGRSYNYRVVMYKKSSELDMRGRCSAGQKVLTSILIRLALAECFGSNCGMIALDEPTTNLDVENAESLANALSNIIEFRKSQKNFQLIVITHDEKFLNHINGGRFVDNFYRIERDEKQHSIIKSLPIHVMQGE